MRGLYFLTFSQKPKFFIFYLMVDGGIVFSLITGHSFFFNGTGMLFLEYDVMAMLIYSTSSISK